MKIRIKIEDVTQDDLVNLLSTALEGSSYLSSDYEEAIDESEDDCYEDTLAKILLNGGRILITDYYAEGSHYGFLPYEMDEDENVTYSVRLNDIIFGLEQAAEGTFNSQSKGFVENERRFARKSFDAFLSEACDFDLTYADCLMQIILFNEIIYG